MDDFAPLYDFSLLEKAVQAFFVALPDSVYEPPADDDDPNRGIWQPEAGNIAFYTAFQNETFQKCRPRVYLALNNITEIPNAQIVDANNTLRAKAWRGTMTFGVVTKPLYPEHVALRTAVMAVIPQLGPHVNADGSAIATSGLNSILTNHEVGIFDMASQSTYIAPEEGNYSSVIPCNITFNIRATKWPGGTLT